MSNNELIDTYHELHSPFDYLPSDGEILPALQAALDNGEYLSDVIERVRNIPLPLEKDARKQAIAYIRQEGLMAQWYAEDLRRQGDPAATDVKELANMVSEVASMYGTAQPSVKREHDEVELEISRNLRESDEVTDDHWVAFARDSQAVHGKIHKAFGIPSTVETLPVLPLIHNSPEEKSSSGLSNKQRAMATVLATAFLSGALPTMAHAASETTPPPTPEAKSTARLAVEATNPNNPSDPANLVALVTPTASTETASTPADLTPAVIPVVVAPSIEPAPTNSGTPEVASPAPKGGDDVGLIPAPIDAKPKPLESTPDAGGTPEIAPPTSPALPPVEAAPAPVPAPAPTPKVPDNPAPAPKTPEVSTAQSDFLQASQDMINAGGVWERRGTAMKFFIDKGLSPAQAAGLIGNLLGESGSALNPGRSQVGGPAFGIAQWEAGRLAGLRAFGGDNYADFNVQLNYIWHELTTTEANALTAIKSATNRQDAAVATRAMYERPSVHRDAERIAYANEVGVQFNVYYQAILAKRPPAERPAPTLPEKVGNVVYTNQLDPAFNDMKYKDGKLVGLTACGSASLDMVANTIGAKPGHGVVMRTMFADGTLPEGGTGQQLIMNEAPKFGLRTEYIKDYSIGAMKKVLDAGGLITFSGRADSQLLPAPGHFVVVYNVNVADGTMQVADPGNPANNGKFFSLQAEVNAGAADAAKGGMGLHYGFIAYYPTVGALSVTNETTAPANAVTTQSSEVSHKGEVVAESADVNVRVSDVSLGAAQQSVDRAKRAVAAAKEAARVKAAARAIADRVRQNAAQDASQPMSQ